MSEKEQEEKIENLSIRVKKLRKQVDKQQKSVMALFDYIKSRTWRKRKRAMIDIIESMLW